MKMNRDEAIAEVRAARTALCARFDNNPRRLLAHLRAEQRHYRGKVIKDWSELQPPDALREEPGARKVQRQ